MNPRGTVGRIYKEEHYTLLQAKFESSGSRRRRFFYVFFHDAPGAGPVWTPRGTVGRIYEEEHYTLLLTKYESSGPCGFGEKVVFMFFPL